MTRGELESPLGRIGVLQRTTPRATIDQVTPDGLQYALPLAIPYLFLSITLPSGYTAM